MNNMISIKNVIWVIKVIIKNLCNGGKLYVDNEDAYKHFLWEEEHNKYLTISKHIFPLMEL